MVFVDPGNLLRAGLFRDTVEDIEGCLYRPTDKQR